tara:strand:- start:259 stop:708 length:450 start_codon:yes stop_codon:yes gene_type:complete
MRNNQEEINRAYKNWTAEDKKRGYRVVRRDALETKRDYDNTIIFESTRAYVSIQPEGFWYHCINMEITKDDFKFRVESGSELGELTFHEMWRSLERAMKASEQIRVDITKELIMKGDKIREEESEEWRIERENRAIYYAEQAREANNNG